MTTSSISSYFPAVDVHYGDDSNSLRAAADGVYDMRRLKNEEQNHGLFSFCPEPTRRHGNESVMFHTVHAAAWALAGRGNRALAPPASAQGSTCPSLEM